jgi:hypothetical protein
MFDMEEIQHARVEAHIQELRQDARRRPAELDVGGRSDGHGAVDPAGRRARIGRWLIGVGSAIAGTTAFAGGHDGHGSERSSDHAAHAA